MTYLEAVDAIRAGTGYRPNTAAIVERITINLREAQRDLEMGKSLPWFLLLEDQPLTLVSGTNSIVLPAGFLREEESEPLRYTPESSDVSNRIVRRVLWDALSSYASTDPAGPKVYALRSGSLYFQPTADRTYNLIWSYYKADAILDGPSTNLWLLFAPDVLVAEAGYRYAQEVRDAEARDIFDVKRKAARSALFSEQIARDDSGGPTSMGSAL